MLMRLIQCLLFLAVSFSSFSQQTNSHTVYFDFNKATISPAEQVRLQEFLKLTQGKIIGTITINGHTDKEGSEKYNNNLSAERAKAVGEITKIFFNSSQTIIEAYGKEMLLNTDPAKQDINRRVEITISYSEPILKDKPTELIPFFEDVELQRFDVNFDDTVIVKGKDGTIIKISPGSIQNKKGEIIKGNAVFELKEYYSAGDILMSGLNTLSGNKMLETGGMFSVLIIKNADTMSDRSLKLIDIRMPVVNEPSGTMNVFERGHEDTTNWQNTGRPFTITPGFWSFPAFTGKLEDWTAINGDVGLTRINYQNWKNGYAVENTEKKYGWNIFKRASKKDQVKRYRQRVQKIDSSTLKVTLNIKYRNFGVKKHHLRDFDTTFFVSYQRREYNGPAFSLNWINCDRFLDYPNVTDYYVSTPKFNGANVMVYFKNQRAFMQAMVGDGDKFKISRIPPGQDVWVVAFGKKDDIYYLGKKEFTTSTKGKAEIDLEQVSKDDFHAFFKSF